MERRSVRVEKVIEAAPQVVFDMLTDSGGLREWFCTAAYTEPHKGGRFHIRWRSGDLAYGKYTQFAPPRALAFSWSVIGERGENAVRITLRPSGDGTRLVLTHSGIRRARAVPGIEREWIAALDNLKSVLETGVDGREARLPRIGLGFESVKSGAGVKVTTVLPEGPADRAGIQKDDVLIGFNGSKLHREENFMDAFTRCRAGQRVRAILVRKGKRYRRTVELGARPVAEIPGDPQALIEHVGRMHAQALNGLRDGMMGMEEDAVSRSPAAGEWSIRECLAHLLTTERAFQAWVADTLLGKEMAWIQARLPEQWVAATAAAPTVTLLLSQLERELLASRAMVGALTSDHLAYKVRYRRIALMLISLATHLQDHVAQVQWTAQSIQDKEAL